ncbi:MAG: hypothetical protein IPO56_13065 [Flavobacteriales bacterium]|nr:hypothetical protein [Flavobacteriales bacterium]
MSLLASCGSLAPTASVRDDVYYMPSEAPVTVSLYDTPAADPAPTTDDYYDANTSQQLGADKSYYDMTYNDPYYYNYGRFGFGTQMNGWQSGWSGAGWGMGMGWGNSGWGSNAGWGYGMGSPWMNPYGYGSSYGYGYGGYNGWNSPWGMNCGGMYNPYGYGSMGYGYGGYQSPYGNCYNCYSPLVTGDTWNGTTVGHRPSMGTVQGARTPGSIQRLPPRNTVGLAPLPNYRVNGQRSTTQDRYRTQPITPGTDRTRTTPNRSPNERTRTAPSPSRSAPQRTIDGGRTSPSPNTGGGGGGGTRTSPSRR